MNSGIPTTREYEACIRSAEFAALEDFADRFLMDHRDLLSRYRRQWVVDPLHQWSRQWEYPFVHEAIRDFLCSRRTDCRIIDAGSGVTFFPYYVVDHYPMVHVHCCDHDEKLIDVYQGLSERLGDRVSFSVESIDALNVEDGSCDLVYCVSVLEHTENHQSILDEFHRVLTPSGRLVVTFDLSLDGDRDISIERADRLLSSLGSRFGRATGDRAVSIAAAHPDILTTRVAGEYGRELLPWRLPALVYQLQALLRGKGLIRWPPALSVYCEVFTKQAG